MRAKVLLLLTILVASPAEAQDRPLRETDFVLDGEYGSAGSRVEEVGTNHFVFHRGSIQLDQPRTTWAQFEIHGGLRGNRFVVDIPGAGLPSAGHNMHYAYSLDGEHWTPVLQELIEPNTSRIELGPFDANHFYFGWQIPFSHDLGLRFVERWLGDPERSRYISVHDVGRSIEGRRLYRIEITDPESPVPREDRWVHWVSSSHPHEGKARWRVYGVADWLLSDEAADHRRRNIWHVAFMMAPDPIARGITRVNMEGRDMNRSYRPEGSDPSQAHEPYLFQREIERIMASNEPLTTFTDMHVWGNQVEPMFRPGPEFGGEFGDWTVLRDIMDLEDRQDLLKELAIRNSSNYSMWDNGVWKQFGITSAIVEGGGTLDTQEENVEAGRVYARSFDAFYRGTKGAPGGAGSAAGQLGAAGTSAGEAGAAGVSAGEAGAAGAEYRPPLYFREDWAEIPPATPVTQAHVAHPELRLHLYGPGADSVRKSNHERPVDDPFYVWSGLCPGPWAVTLEKPGELVDLSRFSKVVWRSKQSGLRHLRLVLKLADGTWLVSDASDGPSADWRLRQFNVADIRWHALDIERVAEGRFVAEPDLTRVEEVGFTDLMPGGGTPASSRLDWIEVYGRSVFQ